VDDQRVLSGTSMVFGLARAGAPPRLAVVPISPPTPGSSDGRRMDAFSRIFAVLADEAGEPDRLRQQGAPHRRLPAQKGASGRCVGRASGGLNARLNAICDGRGRPIVMMLSEGQMHNKKAANVLASALPAARELVAERGDDSNPFRAALAERGITACIPSKKNRKPAIPHDQVLSRQRHPIENALGSLKDWRRVATRYDRCPVILLTAIFIFWISE
jgi:transposase